MENKLVPIEHESQRVITTELLAQVYETDTNNIKNNFNNHKENFKEGIHYYLLKGEELRAFKREVNNIDLVAPNVNQLYLWTERGANRHCKILDTPKAWEQFDNLEETYVSVKEKKELELGALSPELQMFKAIFDSVARTELQQKEQAKALEAVKQKVDGIREVVALNPIQWREESQSIVANIARSLGGVEHIRDIHAEIYELVDARAGCSLKRRLENLRSRMTMEGSSKSKVKALNKLDVIAQDKKLIEIYIAIVKEMAVKHGVTME